MRQKPIDLLSLTPETEVEALISQIVRQEALVSEQRKPQLRKLIYKLIEKIDVCDVTQNFYLFKVSSRIPTSRCHDATDALFGMSARARSASRCCQF